MLSAELKDNTDGGGFAINTGLPFYQFSNDQAWNLKLSSLTRENVIYERGVPIDSIGKKKKNFASYYAWAKSISPTAVNRYRIGWSYRDEEAFATEASPAIQIPEPTTYSSPFFGWQYISQRFIKKTNLFHVAVTEDILIGDNLDVQLGWINSKWGSTDNLTAFDAVYSRGFQPTSRQLAILTLKIDSYFRNASINQGVFKIRGDWFRFHSRRSRLHVYSIIEAGRNLPIDDQISIGGDSGLRGYPLRYQNGDRKFLLSIENRYFFDWYPLRLVKTGVSAFADFGSAWDSELGSAKILRDVGFGFLFASTRQSTNNILRMDFAFPLDDNNTVDSFQVLIGVQKNF